MSDLPIIPPTHYICSCGRAWAYETTCICGRPVPEHKPFVTTQRSGKRWAYVVNALGEWGYASHYHYQSEQAARRAGLSDLDAQ